MKKILVSLTTITPNLWKEKVKEIDNLNIKEIALFLTCLKKKERKELYKKLGKTGLKRIPFVHAREEDMDIDEYDYLTNNFKTKVFNLHPTRTSFDRMKELKKYQKNIFVENIYNIDKEYISTLSVCGGACIDISHWEDFGAIQKGKGYGNFKKILDNSKIGCCHISAITKHPQRKYTDDSGKEMPMFSCHIFSSFSEFDYIKKYKKYLNGYIAIEVENPLAEQLKAKKYIEKLLK